ncbi:MULTISPECIES: YueI family protein [Bacillus]|uniref:YueI family protein n=1 Tax=Bacillus TaxID=1386 RepID=UPI0003050861|nr:MULTISPECIES: YueI family protein [Bacillus]
MSKKTVEDIIEQGIYGVKEINPDERRKFLGTLRERIVIALTAPQVREKNVQTELDEEMRKNKQAKLYLNGNVDYSYLSKYIQKAKSYNITFTIVNNKEHNSEIGLVLAYDYAIDKENIFLQNESKGNNSPIKQPQKSGFSFLKKIFAKK